MLGAGSGDVKPELSFEVPMKVQVIVLIGAGLGVLAGACRSDSSGPGNLASCSAGGTELTLAVAAYQAVDPATDSGCVTIAANTSGDTAEYLVLPWSAGGPPGTSAPFALQSATAQVAAAARQGPFTRATKLTGARGPVAVSFDHFLRQMSRTRAYPGVASRQPSPVATTGPVAPSPPAPGSLRSFKVCSNLTCSAYDTVGAVARAVGTHIAIFVDTLAPSPGLDSATLAGIQQTFDSRLYPLDTVTFGSVSDIDGNSVVIVLMTNTVNKLITKSRCLMDGYVAGFFFAGDIDPTFATQFNNGEIFYSVVADPSGTLSCAHSADDVKIMTPVIFTHEFQHMINFVQHVRVRGGDQEDGWLDEGLSKYAEELAGRSYLPAAQDTFSFYAFNSVADAYQYLEDPASSALMIPADTGTLPEVGASWLFTRYIVDQFGASLPGKLVQTSQIGAANVAAQTGQPFDQTVTRWALANWVSDLPGFAAPAELQYTAWHFRTTFGGLHANDSTDFASAYPLAPAVAADNAVNLTGKLWSGSGAYVRVMQRPNGPAFSLRLSGGASSAISPSIVPRLVVLRIR